MRQEATRLDKLSINLFILADFIYELIKNSFFFWLYFLRGIGITTLFSSTRVLSEVSIDILNKDRKKTSKNYKDKYNNTDKNRLFSLLTFFFILYMGLMVVYPIPSQFEGFFWYIFKYLSLFLIVITITMLFTFPLFSTLYPSIKWIPALIIYFFGKSIIWTVLLLLSNTIILWFSLRNNIFFIGFAPGVLGYINAFIQKKILDRVMSKRQ